MVQLLARILWEGSGLQAQRDALEGLRKVRHTALGLEAWEAYNKVCELTMEAVYSGAESWGLQGWEVSTGR